MLQRCASRLLRRGDFNRGLRVISTEKGAGASFGDKVDVQGLPTDDLPLIGAIKSGGSMETMSKLFSSKASSPTEALRMLEAGNGRFFMGKTKPAELSAMVRRAHIIAQHPFAAVVGCSDSRVPVEIIFDQGLGDIFAVRVVGTVVDTATKGSITYAVDVLKCKVVLVLGHEGCGAVKLAQMPTKSRPSLPSELQKYVIGSIESCLQKHDHLNHICDNRARDREAVVLNTLAQATELLSVKELRQRVLRGDLIVQPAYYDISNGVVDFLKFDIDSVMRAYAGEDGSGSEEAVPVADDDKSVTS